MSLTPGPKVPLHQDHFVDQLLKMFLNTWLRCCSGEPPTRCSQVERTYRTEKELGSITPPSSSPPMCQHEHNRLTYPLDGPGNARLPALRIASIVSSIVNNLVVLYALRCPGLTAAIATAVAALSSGSSTSTTTSYSPKQK